MQAFLTIAVRAARKAGDYIIRESDKIRSVQNKSPGDYVTNVDQTAEAIIIDTIKHSYSDHSFLGEESGQSGSSDYQWVIDPIDGTSNYIQQIPHWAISIACKHKNRTEIGLVFDPVRDELFTAVRGGGAQLNGRRIRVGSSNGLENGLLATGFPFRHKSRIDDYLDIFKRLFPHCADMRRAGSAALDLAYVASGRIDGFWEYDLNEWDTAAGALLVHEAGGMISDFKGNPDFASSDSILAANPKTFKGMLKAINQRV
ncbi:inositol monophosphatase family protein [Aliikangiella sp. G2MR2-5]|uniref:inositol monophosphatase family protein n=1 Tax=Aliikangiella sp. G2MR2-5 TaxID=2788943 RepID=UPI0018AA1D98|nr:inositol monophosphatase family protein [Aliikangiella sp. G2MR2-5]